MSMIAHSFAFFMLFHFSLTYFFDRTYPLMQVEQKSGKCPTVPEFSLHAHEGESKGRFPLIAEIPRKLHVSVQ